MENEKNKTGIQSKPNVLIVDDKPDNLELAQEILEDEGICITIATNGRKAIEITKNEYPDLILLDIAMPEIDGYETCRILKEDKNTSHIPVIFVSARNDSMDVLKGFESGAVDYVHKPFNALELLSRVKTHLDLKLSKEKLLDMNNILEHKVAERTKELKIANEELQEANEKLEHLDTAKSDFLSLISHELRTPLNGIIGYTSLLKKTAKDDKEQKAFLSSLNKLIDSLVKISENSLLFTELRASNYVSKLKPVLIEEATEKALDTFKHQIDEKDITYQNLTVNSNISILSDQYLLINCLEILLDNAVKFSPHEGLITLKATYDDEVTTLEIKDEGPGFTQKALDNVFQVFERDNFQNAYTGFGLGMATAKLIMDALKGKIKIQNDENGGAVVALTFKSLVR